MLKSYTAKGTNQNFICQQIQLQKIIAIFSLVCFLELQMYMYKYYSFYMLENTMSPMKT